MTIRVRGFVWDDDNRGHLEQAHPHIALGDLQDIVIGAKRYARVGRDRFDKTVFGARRGKLTVLFTILPGSKVRIFSVSQR